MSIRLHMVAPHRMVLDGYVEDLGAWLVERVKELALPPANSVHKNKDGSTTLVADTPSYDYEIRYISETRTICVCANAHGHMLSSIDVLPDCVIITSLHHYSILYSAYELDWWKTFRTDLYRMLRITLSEECIYLPEDLIGHAKLFNQAEEGEIGYHELKGQLYSTAGEPLQSFDERSCWKLGNGEGQWFLDTFDDIRSEFLPPAIDEFYHETSEQ